MASLLCNAKTEEQKISCTIESYAKKIFKFPSKQLSFSGQKIILDCPSYLYIINSSNKYIAISWPPTPNNSKLALLLRPNNQRTDWQDSLPPHTRGGFRLDISTAPHFECSFQSKTDKMWNNFFLIFIFYIFKVKNLLHGNWNSFYLNFIQGNIRPTRIDTISTTSHSYPNMHFLQSNPLLYFPFIKSINISPWLRLSTAKKYPNGQPSSTFESSKFDLDI